MATSPLGRGNGLVEATGTGQAAAAADDQRGFTLLELVVVLTVAGLILAVALPSFLGRGQPLETRRLVAQLEGDLRQARRAALLSHRGVGVRIDLARRELLSDSGALRRLPAGLDLTLEAARVLQQGAHSGGFWFYPDGSSTGGRLTLSDGRHSYRIEVDWLTGRVASTPL